MKTTQYNPSQIELDFEKAVIALKDVLQAQVPQYQITSLRSMGAKDNPDVLIHLTDADGDEHELVIKFIQRPDMY